MYFPIFWRHFISKIVIRDTYWRFLGVFNGKFEFTIKDPPKKTNTYHVLQSSAILLIKCLKKIRKYIVDTCLEFKYSLANNGGCSPP